MDCGNQCDSHLSGAASYRDKPDQTLGDEDNSQESTTNSSTSSHHSATTGPSTASSSETCTNHNDKEGGATWSSSLVEYYGPSSSFCGYCKKYDPNSNGGRRSYDLQSYQLSVRDYQDFLDRGWRRSGKICYYPINQTTCCPNFSITCQAIKFQLTRSQRKCIKRLNNFLVTGSIKEDAPIKYEANNDIFKHIPKEAKSNPSGKARTFDQLRASSKARARRFVRACELKSLNDNISIESARELVEKKWQDRRQETLSLEDYLYPINKEQTMIDTKHKLKINMFFVDSSQSKELREEEHNIMVDYQRTVHQETRREWTMSRYCDFLVSTPLIVEPLGNYDYLSDQDKKEKETLSKDIYPEGVFQLFKPPQLPTSFGTYHCSYHLDDKLIAVGVLDVLPKCITTVYFFYDPNYAFLNLGVYSALVEISMIRQMWSHYKTNNTIDNHDARGVQQTDENILKHYYLGYYVHECKKMHYKTRFKPSYLLCCKSYNYIATEKCLEKLKNTKYADFSDQQDTSIAKQDSTIEPHSLLEITIEWPMDIKEHAMTQTKLLNYLLWLETNLDNESVELFINGYIAVFAHLIGLNLLERLCLKTNLVHKTLTRRRERILHSRRQRSSTLRG